MNIKKLLIILLPVVLISVLFITYVLYLHTTVSIKIITSEENIKKFYYDTSVVKPEDYQEYIKKIERMRFLRKSPNPQSKEMYLYVRIESIDGIDEVIACNDDLITHTYNGENVEIYKIPLLTQYYILYSVKG